jgi:hypothetical protein
MNPLNADCSSSNFPIFPILTGTAWLITSIGLTEFPMGIPIDPEESQIKKK